MDCLIFETQDADCSFQVGGSVGGRVPLAGAGFIASGACVVLSGSGLDKSIPLESAPSKAPF